MQFFVQMVINVYTLYIKLWICIHSDEGLTLEMSASESLYGGQFTLSTQLIKQNYLVILPPTQHHSFFRNLPPLFLYYRLSVLQDCVHFMWSQTTCTCNIFYCSSLIMTDNLDIYRSVVKDTNVAVLECLPVCTLYMYMMMC